MGNKGFSFKGFIDNFNQSNDAKDESSSVNNSHPDDTNVSFAPEYYKLRTDAFTKKSVTQNIPATVNKNGKARTEDDVYKKDTSMIVSATDEEEINTDFDLEAFEVQYCEINGQKYSGMQLINPAAKYLNYTPAAIN